MKTSGGIMMNSCRCSVAWGIAAAVAILIHGAIADLQIKHEKDVILLNSQNFHHVVNSNEIVLVLFHAPWDPEYRAILPEFEWAAKRLAEDTPSVLLARLDTSLSDDVAKELDIRGDQAQFLYYHLGKPYNFEDFSTGDKLVKFLKERSQIMYSPPRPHPELVDELSQHEFAKTLERTKFAVVAFYKTNCPACVRLLLEYETAIVNLTDVPQARFFKINLDTAPEVGSRYGIKDVPVLKIFRNGKIFDFNSDSKLVTGILQYIKKQLLPPYREYSTREQAEGWIRSYPNKPAVVGVFEKTDTPRFQLFTDAANLFRDTMNFVLMTKAAPADQPTLTKLGPFVEGTIAVFPPPRHVSPEDKKIYVFSDTAPTFESLSPFIAKKTIPVVGQRTKKNMNTIYADKRPLLIGYLTVNWTKDHDHDTVFHRNKIAQVVGVSKDVTFAISDKREFKDELTRMGLHKAGEELLIGIMGKNGEYYPGPVVEMMNLKILTDFAQDHLAGKLKPYRRTQSPPTSDDSDDYPVKTVVGATFRKLVFQHGKPVVLLVHRPMCPLCRTAMKLLEDLAHDKDLYPSVVYAAIDALANDPPARFVPKTYPTLFFVHPRSEKQPPVPYASKNFTKEAVMEFLDGVAPSYRIKTEL